MHTITRRCDNPDCDEILEADVLHRQGGPDTDEAMRSLDRDANRAGWITVHGAHYCTEACRLSAAEWSCDADTPIGRYHRRTA